MSYIIRKPRQRDILEADLCLDGSAVVNWDDPAGVSITYHDDLPDAAELEVEDSTRPGGG